MSMLELSHVKKSFKENPVIRDISISVEQGDVVAVLGPSGSGKTTLLRCAGYLSQADGGTVTLDGETFDLHRISKRDVVRYRRKIGFVFQSFNLFGNKTALQNVTAGLTIARKMDKKEAERIGLYGVSSFLPRSIPAKRRSEAALPSAMPLFSHK